MMFSVARVFAIGQRALGQHQRRARSGLVTAMVPPRRFQATRRLTTTIASAAEGAPTASSDAGSADGGPDYARLDLRVGKILKCWVHPDADSLYVEEIDVGEGAPRQICSGLVQHVTLEQMQGRACVVMCNLKPRNMRGVESNGMVLAASNATRDKIELLDPPAGSQPGERLAFGAPGAAQGPADTPNRLQKKKVWEAVQPKLRTTADRVAAYADLPLCAAAGPVTAATLAGGSIA